MPFEYLAILTGLFITSFILHEHFKIKLFKTHREAFIFYLVLYVIGIVWDEVALYRGHWVYPGRGILGIFIDRMPLEDFILIFVIGYVFLTLYKVVIKKI